MDTRSELPRRKVGLSDPRTRSVSVLPIPTCSSRKVSSVELPRQRKLSLQAEYQPTTNPFVLAKKTSVVDDGNPGIQECRSRRASHFWLPTQEPVKPRQRSHTVTTPPTWNLPEDLDEDEIEEDEEEDLEFVDVRDEILLIKDQFDKLVSILDKDIFPLEENEENEGPKGPTITAQLFVVMGIAIGHILDGTVLAYTSTAIPSIERDNSTFDSESNLKPFIYSAHSIGATVACFLAGIAMSTLGRRGATLFLNIPCYLVGYLIVGCANSYIMLILGRFITGLGLGMTLTIPNVYIVEVTSPQFRGVLGVLPNLFCQLGIFITYVLGHWLDHSQLAFTFAALNAFFFVAVYYIPESPLYLMSKGLEKEAEAVLNRLDVDLSAMATFQESLDHNKDAEVMKQITKSANYKPFLSGIILMAFFQTTAYPLLIGNTVTLFREANESLDEHIASIIVGMTIVVCAMISIPLAKKCNRKTLLGISALGVSACLFMMGAFYYLKTYEDVYGLGWMPLVDFIIYIGFFMGGYGSVSWLVFAEVLPPEIRPTVYPLGIAIMWFINFILTTLYEPMLKQIGTCGVLWTYAGISSLGCIFIAICLPETQGKTSFEIASFYQSNRIRSWISANKRRYFNRHQLNEKKPHHQEVV